MRPTTLAAVPVLVFSLGCMVDNSERVGYALDYRIDRPRVLAIALDPPVLVHGQTVTLTALALGPGNADPDSLSVDVCGLETDRAVEVDNQDCFHNADLVTHLGDGTPLTYDPPDLSRIDCPEPDTGWNYDGPAQFPDSDAPPELTWDCGSEVPLMVTANFGKKQAFASLDAPFRYASLEEGEFVPTSRWKAERHLTWTGEVAAGAEVELTFTIAVESPRFSWFVDGGELVGTGYTSDYDPDTENGFSLTRNTLRIPADWHGPLRVVAVAIHGYDSWQYGVVGDTAWSVETLEVP